MTSLHRFPITPDQIAQVVRIFYMRVRNNPVLGPVFAVHVSQWPTHEEKITQFWCNAILGTQSYSGNPMREHLAAGNVRPAHFALWLALFDEVLETVLDPATAQSWSALAHRIGRGLRMGLEQHTSKGPPNLRLG